MRDGKIGACCRSCGSELPAVSSEIRAGFCRSCLVRKQEAEATQRDRSIQWFRKHAEQRNGRAQHFLGMMYASGEIIQKDEVQAHVWFCLAAMEGHEDAMMKRETIAARMTAEQIAEAKCLARTWAKKLRGEGHVWQF